MITNKIIDNMFCSLHYLSLSFFLMFVYKGFYPSFGELSQMSVVPWMFAYLRVRQ